MRQVRFTSHYNSIQLTMRISDEAFAKLQQADNIGEFIDDERQRRVYGRPTLLSDYQYRKLDNYLVDSGDYFDDFQML